jgi:hypothetical protein
MRIVRENINFERGLDPKESMGLGYKSIHTHEQMQKVFPKAIEERSSWEKGSLYNLGNGLYAETKFQRLSKEPMGSGAQGVTGPQGLTRFQNPRIGVQGTTTFSSDFDIVRIFQKFPTGEKTIWKNPIFENINFERGMEPKQSMNIGKMKKIQDWMNELFVGVKMEKYPNLSWIKNGYKVNPDFSIFTDKDIILTERRELVPNGKLPEHIRFHTSGSFDIDDCGLVSLEGCPRYVQGYFSCQQNEITSLEGFPIKIEKDCYVMSNGKDFIKDEIEAVCEVGGQIEADDSDV